MKKVVFCLVVVFLVTGCFNNSQKREDKKKDPKYLFCKQIEKVNDNVEIAQMDSLKNELDNINNKFCINSDAKLCNLLNEAIEATQKEITYQDCNRTESWWNESWENLCHSSNELEESNKELDVSEKVDTLQSKCLSIINKIEREEY